MRATARRAVIKGARTFAQTLAAVLTAAGTGLIETDWIGAVSAAGMAGVIAVLMNLSESDSSADQTPKRPETPAP